MLFRVDWLIYNCAVFCSANILFRNFYYAQNLDGEDAMSQKLASAHDAVDTYTCSASKYEKQQSPQRTFAGRLLDAFNKRSTRINSEWWEFKLNILCEILVHARRFCQSVGDRNYHMEASAFDGPEATPVCSVVWPTGTERQSSKDAMKTFPIEADYCDK
jgi:hypothetical protein